MSNNIPDMVMIILAYKIIKKSFQSDGVVRDEDVDARRTPDGQNSSFQALII